MVTAAVAARGETEIGALSHIDRGYENFENKLRKLGAKIQRFEDDDSINNMGGLLNESRL